MQRNTPPIQQPLAREDGFTSQVWVQWFSKLPLEGILNAGAEPVVSENQCKLWLASDSGTKDGVSYSQGDLLVTINIGGVSKTKLIADYSAL